MVVSSGRGSKIVEKGGANDSNAATKNSNKEGAKTKRSASSNSNELKEPLRSLQSVRFFGSIRKSDKSSSFSFKTCC